MKPITVPRGVSRPSSNGSVGGDAGDPVEAAGAGCTLCARTKAGHTTLSASNRRPSLGEMRNNLAKTLCIFYFSLRGKRPIRIVSSQRGPGEATCWLGSFLEPLACRGGIPVVIAMPAKQKLIGHSGDVIAHSHVPRLIAD